VEPTDVRIIGWDQAVGDVLTLVFFVGVLFGSILVALLTALTLSALARRGA